MHIGGRLKDTHFSGYECSCRKNFNNNFVKDEAVDEVVASHTENFSDVNVTRLIFKEIGFKFIPKNLSNFFPSVIFLLIEEKSLIKIEKNDFGQFKNLKILRIICEEIYKIKKSFLKLNSEIFSLHFSSQKLEFIHPNVIKKLRNPKVIKFEGKCIGRDTNEEMSLFEWNYVASSCAYPGTAFCIFDYGNDENNFYTCVVGEWVKTFK